MKRLLILVALLLFSRPLMAQNSGILMPALPPSFLNASGLVAASAKLCSFKAGSTTVYQSLYSDSALSSALPNPTSLNALGIPQTSGNVSTQTYLTPGLTYKFVLYAAGTGNTCNGTAVGSVIWTRDNVYDYAGLTSFSNIRLCDRFTGATAGAKIVACIADLPSGGGTADARGIVGTQTISADVFSGVTKPVVLMMGAGTYTISVQQTIGKSISILGSGSQVTAITCSGNVDCFRIKDGATVLKAGTFSGFAITGNSGASANGIHVGDIIGATFNDIHIKGFTAGAAVWLDNTLATGTRWTERNVFTNMWYGTNKYGLRFTVNGGLNSFLGNSFTSQYFNLVATGDIAIQAENTSVIYGNTFQGVVNKDYSAAGTTFLSLLNTANMSNNTYSMYVEDTGGGGGTGISCATNASFSGTGLMLLSSVAGWTESCPQKTQYLPSLNQVVATGIVESSQIVATRATTSGIGTYLMPGQAAAGTYKTGTGFNLSFNGTNWVAKGDGGSNGGAAILSAYGTGDVSLYVVPNIAGTDQTITNSNLDKNNITARFTDSALQLFGTNYVMRKFYPNAHAAANAPASIMLAMNDGNGNCGYKVNNITQTGFSSQTAAISVGHGGVTACTDRLTIGSDGQTGVYAPLTINSTAGAGSPTSMIKHVQFGAGCATAAAIGAMCNSTYSWGTSNWTDTAYFTSCTAVGITSGVPVVAQINTKSTTQVVITFAALTAAAAQAAAVDCIAFR